MARDQTVYDDLRLTTESEVPIYGSDSAETVTYSPPISLYLATFCRRQHYYWYMCVKNGTPPIGMTDLDCGSFVTIIVEERRAKDEGRRTKNEERRTKSEERRAKIEERRAKREERRAESEERRTKNEERRTKNEERRTKSEERRAKSEERRAKNEERRTKNEERYTNCEM
ncbi:chromatin assembly factor 1 subunit A-like [Photinus pyralis]|uniref:chromatin assembly factor 1 subunit A-like n=1 Tax=Photinus pyralis TaxID=7054 RepID=UPI001267155D|nr:chromatin assembly factor 1 subunit A-like [Photinus pyralis]